MVFAAVVAMRMFALSENAEDAAKRLVDAGENENDARNRARIMIDARRRAEHRCHASRAGRNGEGEENGFAWINPRYATPRRRRTSSAFGMRPEMTTLPSMATPGVAMRPRAIRRSIDSSFTTSIGSPS